MNSTLEIFNQITLEEYGLMVLCILFIFFLLYRYSLLKEKKNLERILDSNIKVFQKAFDASEDAILIRSDKNEVIYANV